jgi:dCMP deaminase
MKDKHLKFYLSQVQELAELSTCSRNKFGALIIDEKHNCILMNGYNGTARGSRYGLCGGCYCIRDKEQIKSGTQVSIGCNHAESNAIANCARLGIPTFKKSIIVSGEPCINCAKLIVQAGLDKVYYINAGYSSAAGIEYLKQNNIELILL